MYNSKVFQLLNDIDNQNQDNQDNQLSYYMLDMDQVDYPVLMIHACCVNRQQSDKYFGQRNDWRTGLCSKRQAKLYHNCYKNNFFFLDPYVARMHRLIYFDH